MRTHQSLQKKATAQQTNTPSPNPLAIRPFAAQPKAEETERSQKPRRYESTLGNFAILSPQGRQAIPLQPKLVMQGGMATTPKLNSIIQPNFSASRELIQCQFLWGDSKGDEQEAYKNIMAQKPKNVSHQDWVNKLLALSGAAKIEDHKTLNEIIQLTKTTYDGFDKLLSILNIVSGKYLLKLLKFVPAANMLQVYEHLPLWLANLGTQDAFDKAWGEAWKGPKVLTDNPLTRMNQKWGMPLAAASPPIAADPGMAPPATGAVPPSRLEFVQNFKDRYEKLKNELASIIQDLKDNQTDLKTRHTFLLREEAWRNDREELNTQLEKHKQQKHPKDYKTYTKKVKEYGQKKSNNESNPVGMKENIGNAPDNIFKDYDQVKIDFDTAVKPTETKARSLRIEIRDENTIADLKAQPEPSVNDFETNVVADTAQAYANRREIFKKLAIHGKVTAQRPYNDDPERSQYYDQSQYGPGAYGTEHNLVFENAPDKSGMFVLHVHWTKGDYFEKAHFKKTGFDREFKSGNAGRDNVERITMQALNLLDGMYNKYPRPSKDLNS